MSILIDDCSVALVAPRPRTPFAGARLLVDVQPRLLSRSPMPIADMAWRLTDGPTERGLEAAQQGTQGGRAAVAGAAYVTTAKHFSIRSGPPTRRP